MMPRNKPLSLHIEAERTLLKNIPEKWMDFFRITGQESDAAVLYLREAPWLNEKGFPEGWSRCTVNGSDYAVFVIHGKASFAVSYNPSADKATVYIRRAVDGFVHSGILYGMLTALHRAYVGLHGVTLSVKGRNVILSAPSGTGKTTMSRLLEAECGARVINGDFALMSVGEEGVMFEPTPFCGTSGICLDERVRVDRIVFLEQSETNRWRDLDGRTAMLNFLKNAFVPSFDRQLEQAVQENIIQMLTKIPASSYAFTPTSEAAIVFQDMIQREEASSH